MTGDFLAQLQAFQDYTAGLQAMLSKVEAGTAQRAVGTDRTGTVTVNLAPDGVPESARVERDWLRRLKADRFTDAVVEASQVAASKRLERWADALPDSARGAGRSNPQAVAGRSDGRPPNSAAAAWTPVQAPTGQPVRSADMLAEDMLNALRDIDQIAARSQLASQGTGSDLVRRLTVTVSRAGLVSCTAPPRWLANQSNSALTSALNEALTAAREDLARASATPGPGARLDQLFAEAMALLTSPLTAHDGRGDG